MWFVWSDGLTLDQANKYFSHLVDRSRYKEYEFKVVPSEWYNSLTEEVKYYQVEGRKKIEDQSQEQPSN